MKVEDRGQLGQRIATNHVTLGEFFFEVETLSSTTTNTDIKKNFISEPSWLFTDNETNYQRLYNSPNSGYVKDAFHEYVVHGQKDAVNPKMRGTKVTPYHVLQIPANSEVVLRLRLYSATEQPKESFGPAFDKVFSDRRKEMDQFYDNRISPYLTAEEKKVSIQAFAGLLWSKQSYHFIIKDWIEGDPEMVRISYNNYY
jgi:hypothetical protein